MRPHLVLSLVVLGLVAAPAAHAAPVLVDDDKQQCPSAPFTTIQSAVGAAGDGDTISVCAGTYTEQVKVSGKSLTIAGRTGNRDDVVLGLPAAPAVSKPFGENQSPFLAIVESNWHDITVRDLTLHGYNRSAAGGQHTGILLAWGGATVDNVEITGMGTAGGHPYGIHQRLEDGSAKALLVEDSTIRQTNGYGLNATGNVPAAQRKLVRTSFVGPGKRDWTAAVAAPTVEVRDSTFRGYQSDQWSGSYCSFWDGGLVFETPGGGSPVITGSTFEDVDCVLRFLNDGGTDSELTFTGNRVKSAYAVAYLQGTDAVIRGNVFEDLQHGLSVYALGGAGATEVEIVGNAFLRGIGVHFLATAEGTSEKVLFRDNRFVDQHWSLVTSGDETFDARGNWFSCDGTAGWYGCGVDGSGDTPDPDSSQRLSLVVEAAGALHPGEPGVVRARIVRADGSVAKDFPDTEVALTASAGTLADTTPPLVDGEAMTVLTPPATGDVALGATLDHTTVAGTAKVTDKPQPQVDPKPGPVDPQPAPKPSDPPPPVHHTPTRPVQPVQPSVAITRVRTGKGRRLLVTVKVSVPGRVTVSAGGRRSTAALKAAGSRVLRLTAGRAGRATLKVAFAPAAGGRALAASRKVTVRR